jgi:hypothetical protein
LSDVSAILAPRGACPLHLTAVAREPGLAHGTENGAEINAIFVIDEPITRICVTYAMYQVNEIEPRMNKEFSSIDERR